MEASLGWRAFLNFLENCSTPGSIAVFEAICENVQVIGVFFLDVVELID